MEQIGAAALNPDDPTQRSFDFGEIYLSDEESL